MAFHFRMTQHSEHVCEQCQTGRLAVCLSTCTLDWAFSRTREGVLSVDRHLTATTVYGGAMMFMQARTRRQRNIRSVVLRSRDNPPHFCTHWHSMPRNWGPDTLGDPNIPDRERERVVTWGVWRPG